jgi:hypothetical protein
VLDATELRSWECSFYHFAEKSYMEISEKTLDDESGLAIEPAFGRYEKQS